MTSRSRTVHTVTEARRPRSEDIRRRQTRYLLHSGLRTVCLVVAVAVPVPPPLRVILVIGAVAVPCFAVIVANGTSGPEPAPRFDRWGARGVLGARSPRVRR